MNCINCRGNERFIRCIFGPAFDHHLHPIAQYCKQAVRPVFFLIESVQNTANPKITEADPKKAKGHFFDIVCFIENDTVVLPEHAASGDHI